MSRRCEWSCRTATRSSSPLVLGGKFTLAFTPVVSRWIEPIDGTVTLHSGRWSVGEDLAPGRYVADVAPGARGFLSVDRAGIRTAMELLGLVACVRGVGGLPEHDLGGAFICG